MSVLKLLISYFLLSTYVYAQSTGNFQIINDPTTGKFDISRHNEYHFKNRFNLIQKKYNILKESELKKHIEELELRKGNKLVKKKVYIPEVGVIVGITRGNFSINVNLIKKSKSSNTIFISFRDQNGNFVTLPKEQIGIFTIEGLEVPYSLRNFSQVDTEVYFAILLDKSGSMADVIDQVRSSAEHFMKTLPASAKCKIISFNEKYNIHNNYTRCNTSYKLLNTIRAGGKTDIYTPLSMIYKEYGKISVDFKAILIITDGVGTVRYISKKDVLRLKNSPTFVYWLGDYNNQDLENIADTYIYGRKDTINVLNLQL